MKLRNVCIFLFGLVLIGAVLLACGASNNTGTASSPSSSNNTTTSAPKSAPTKAPTNQHFKVGQTVTVGSTWKVVVNSVKPYTGDTTYNPPKKGEYILVDVSLTNISQSEQDVSSIAMFTLRDSSGQEYTETILTDAGNPPDGKVEAGSPIRGTLAYDVPKGQKLTLAFAPDMLSGGQTIWDINS